MPTYNKGMASLSEMTARNAAQYQSDFNKRGTQMVREFCSEHSATSHGSEAEFVFGYDTDLSLCTEWQFKLYFTASSSIEYTPPVSMGSNTYPTYDLWVAAYPVGSATNTDNAWGCQCWDYGDAFWQSQVGRRLLTGSSHGVYESWSTNRNANAGNEFELIYSWSQIKKGDWIIWDKGRFADDTTGHIAMAAENANGNNPILCYGQNQGGTPTIGGGSTLNLKAQTNYKFLGAFRYKNWK